MIFRRFFCLALLVILAGCSNQATNSSGSPSPIPHTSDKQVKLKAFDFATPSSSPSHSPTPTPTHQLSPTPTPFYSPTPTATVGPSPTPICIPDGGKNTGQGNCICLRNWIHCVNHRCVDVSSDLVGYNPTCDSLGYNGTTRVTDMWCADPNLAPSDGIWCIGKPVIYLYPPKPAFVDVVLTIPGTIYQSIPHYPTAGWQKVLANPDGSLVYQGNDYKELYYESTVTTIAPPRTGIILKMSHLRQTLSLLTGQLGLQSHEQEEFLTYWLPKLNNLHTPYILFSVIDNQEKERVDGVTITPKPDTFIAFLAYFKPLSQPIVIDPLVLPEIPKRTGFTAVEWGGTIDITGD